MPSTLYVVPVAVNGGSGAVTGTNAETALSDASDATCVDVTSGGTNTVTVTGFGTPAIPALAQIRYVFPQIRHDGTAGPATAKFTLIDGRVGVINWPTIETWYPTPSGPIIDDIAPSVPADADGNPWTAASVASLDMALQAFAGATIKLYRVSLGVVYNQAPAITAIGVTNAPLPTISFTYTDPDGDACERVHAKVFTAAQAAAAGFSAETSTPVWDSGELFTRATVVQVSTFLDTGAYVAYVKAADVGSGGAYGAWASQAFTLLLWPAATPHIVYAEADDPDASVHLAIRAFDNLCTWRVSAAEAASVAADHTVNCAVAQIGTQLYTPPGQAQLQHSWQVTATADGDALFSTETYYTRPAVHTAFFAIQSKTGGALRTAVANLFFYDDAGDLLLEASSTPVAEIAGQWVFPLIEGTAPAGTTKVILQVRVIGCLAGEQHVVVALEIFPGTMLELQAASGGTLNPPAWTRGGVIQGSPQVALERSMDGVNWTSLGRLFREPLRGFAYLDGISALPFTVDFVGNEPVYGVSAPISAGVLSILQTIEIIDYEAPRGVDVFFRAQIVTTDSFGNQLASGWSPLAAAHVAVSGTFFKAINNPNLNRRLYTKKPGVQAVTKERQLVQEVMGSRVPVVLFDTVLLDVLSFTVVCLSDDDRVAYRAIQATQDFVLIQDHLGREWYTHLGPQATATPGVGAVSGAGIYEIAHTAQELVP